MHKFFQLSSSQPDINNTSRYHIRHRTDLQSIDNSISNKSVSKPNIKIHNLTQTESDSTNNQGHLLTLSTLQDAINTGTRRHRSKKPTLLKILSSSNIKVKKRPNLNILQDDVIEDHLQQHLLYLKKTQNISIQQLKDKLKQNVTLNATQRLSIPRARKTKEQIIIDNQPPTTPQSQFSLPIRIPSPIKPSPRKDLNKARPSLQASILKQRLFFSTKPIVSQISLNKSSMTDPSQFEKIDQYKFFFRDLLNNLKILISLTKQCFRIIERTSGYNWIIRDLIFEYDEDKQVLLSLQLLSPIQLYEKFLVRECGLVNLRNCIISDLIKIFENSECFRKLQYFSSGISEYLNRRLQEQFNKKIEARNNLLEGIYEIMGNRNESQMTAPSKYQSPKRFHDVRHCKDFINSYDLLKCELMDKYEQS